MLRTTVTVRCIEVLREQLINSIIRPCQQVVVISCELVHMLRMNGVVLVRL